MNRTIWKHSAPPPGCVETFATHEGARIVHVAAQGEIPYFWFEFDRDAPEQVMTVATLGAGWDVPDGLQYGGTIFDGALVWHLYWATGEKPND